jgi:hypothetical protein
MPPLVSAGRPEEHLEDPDLCVFDRSGGLAPDPERIFRSERGRSSHKVRHSPGAGYPRRSGLVRAIEENGETEHSPFYP